MRPLRSLLLCILILLLLAAARAEAAAVGRLLLQAQTMTDGAIRVTATVTEPSGTPLADVPVTFKARTTFGWLILAETTTGKDGKAQTILQRPPASGEVTVEAGDEEVISAGLWLGARKTAPPRIRPGRDALSRLSPQPGFISPYLVPLQVALLGLILGGIWTTYGYVVWLLLRIRQSEDLGRR